LLRFSCMIAALHQIDPLKSSLYVCASQMAIHQITCNPWVTCRDGHVMLIFMWHYFYRSERIAFLANVFFMNCLMAVWLSSSDFACYPSLQVSVHKDDENLSIYNLSRSTKVNGEENILNFVATVSFLNISFLAWIPTSGHTQIVHLKGEKGYQEMFKSQNCRLTNIACSRIVWFWLSLVLEAKTLQ